MPRPYLGSIDLNSPLKWSLIELNWVDVSDIFYFSARGEGKGESEAPGRGWGRAGRGGGARGREGVCAEFGGGGTKYFFSGPKRPPS